MRHFSYVGVMVPCLMQLLVRRFADPDLTLGSLYALAGVPIAAYVVSTALVLRKPWTRDNTAADLDRKNDALEALAEPVAPAVEVQAGASDEHVVPGLGDAEANRVLLF